MKKEENTTVDLQKVDTATEILIGAIEKMDCSQVELLTAITIAVQAIALDNNRDIGTVLHDMEIISEQMKSVMGGFE